MKELIPFQNINEAMNHLDNGGHFFNLFTKAGDGEINAAELAKVAGMTNEKQHLILFLELSISKLAKIDQVEIISSLDDKLRRGFLKYKAHELMVHEVDHLGVLGGNVILTGIPTVKESKSEFNGFILIPIFTGKVTMFVPEPVMDRYDLYEISNDHNEEVFLIAHDRGKLKLPAEKIKVAGVVKEIETKVNGIKGMQKFLEINYFSLL
ncbi:hypothetical protein OQY15_14200 [Pedobacter sp. MC2016-15]|uniref:hypothetical protein n=1 Tax=Pedobacter sp. MC2016-15 TaxID=2994473 RepID=UPI002245CB27|nr:hypothetical protein [Pedobacter sp. MC2016-15]MCX2480248.1 hypothetical protein [Pedobacter sp. MC2016-15]